MHCGWGCKIQECGNNVVKGISLRKKQKVGKGTFPEQGLWECHKKVQKHR